MSHKQVFIEEACGKTIAKVFVDYSDEILVVFTDQTFALIYGYTVDDDTTVENGDFQLWNWRKQADELLSLGVITQSQYDRNKEAIEKEQCKAVEMRRAEYERLKAEFGESVA